MYESFFGLHREPFSVAPDPRFLFLSPKHREALSHLMHGLRGGGGFVLLTGEIGAGKTTVWRTFLEQLPGNYDVAYVVNPKLGVAALMARVCEDLRVELPDGVAATDPVDAIHGHLLLSHAGGRRTLIVVDEAQALSLDVLEQLRLLTNLVTAEHKLVQVLLIGQPELRTMLEMPVLEPTAQRVVARYHLQALSEDETVGYIRHRLKVAGLQGELPFDSDALGRVHRLCGGVPRRINVLCDRALLGAHAQQLRRVDRATVERAAQEVFGAPRAAPSGEGLHTASADVPRGWVGAGVAVLAVLGVVAIAPWLAERWASAQAILAGGAPGAAVVSTAPAGLAAPATPAGAMAPVAPVVPAAPAAPAATAVAAVAARPAAPAASVLGAASTAPAAAAASSALAVAAAVPATAVAGATRAPATAAAMLAGAAAGPAAAAPASPLEALFASAPADEARAWRALAGLWGVVLPAEEPCGAALAASLQCYRGRGGLAPIRQVDRPVLLALADARGRTVHAVMVALGGDSATLRVGDVDHVVPLAALARVWRGEFTTLWRAPPGFGDGALVAAEGPLGSWLAQKLAAADGSALPAASAEALGAQVFAFQLAQGLAPDGLAGPLTLMKLNRASGVDEPRLLAAR
jgi:general secretion pathway protein A